MVFASDLKKQKQKASRVTNVKKDEKKKRNRRRKSSNTEDDDVAPNGGVGSGACGPDHVPLEIQYFVSEQQQQQQQEDEDNTAAESDSSNKKNIKKKTAGRKRKVADDGGKSGGGGNKRKKVTDEIDEDSEVKSKAKDKDVLPNSLDEHIQNKIRELQDRKNLVPEMKAKLEELKTQRGALDVKGNRAHIRLAMRFDREIEQQKKDIERIEKNCEIKEFKQKTTRFLQEQRCIRAHQAADQRRQYKTSSSMGGSGGGVNIISSWEKSSPGSEKGDLLPNHPSSSMVAAAADTNTSAESCSSNTNTKPTSLFEKSINAEASSSHIGPRSGGLGSAARREMETETQEIRLLREVMAEVDKKCPKVHVNICDVCPRCDKLMNVVTHSSAMYCDGCGYTHSFLDATAASMAYGEEMEYTSFAYQRMSHFNEWLNSFQAKEATEVPLKVINRIMEYFFEKGVRDKNEITLEDVHTAMRILGYRKHYDHQQQVLTRITGKPPPRMAPEQEERCRMMFLAIQGPWLKHKPKDRKNMLSYSYCLYKFCELLGYRKFMPFFPLLKGADKLSKQDEMFEKICGELDWEFRASSRDHQKRMTEKMNAPAKKLKSKKSDEFGVVSKKNKTKDNKNTNREKRKNDAVVPKGYDAPNGGDTVGLSAAESQRDTAASRRVSPKGDTLGVDDDDQEDFCETHQIVISLYLARKDDDPESRIPATLAAMEGCEAIGGKNNTALIIKKIEDDDLRFREIVEHEGHWEAMYDEHHHDEGGDMNNNNNKKKNDECRRENITARVRDMVYDENRGTLTFNMTRAISQKERSNVLYAFGEGACDSWMEGDIRIFEDYELHTQPAEREVGVNEAVCQRCRTTVNKERRGDYNYIKTCPRCRISCCLGEDLGCCAVTWCQTQYGICSDCVQEKDYECTCEACGENVASAYPLFRGSGMVFVGDARNYGIKCDTCAAKSTSEPIGQRVPSEGDTPAADADGKRKNYSLCDDDKKEKDGPRRKKKRTNLLSSLIISE